MISLKKPQKLTKKANTPKQTTNKKPKPTKENLMKQLLKQIQEK